MTANEILALERNCNYVYATEESLLEAARIVFDKDSDQCSLLKARSLEEFIAVAKNTSKQNNQITTFKPVFQASS